MNIFVQIGNIGSEITRARVWQEKGDSASRDKALQRALGLIGLALSGELRPTCQRELAYLQNVIMTIMTGSPDYSLLNQLENYCLPFALLARRHK